MKKLSLALIALFAMATTAQAQTCFRADQATPESIPAELCLDSASYERENTILKMVVEGGNLAGAYSLTDRKSEGFQANKILFQKGEGSCEEREIAYLELASPFTADEAIEPSALAVTLVLSTTNDSCHVKPDFQFFTYSLVK